MVKDLLIGNTTTYLSRALVSETGFGGLACQNVPNGSIHGLFASRWALTRRIDLLANNSVREIVLWSARESMSDRHMTGVSASNSVGINPWAGGHQYVCSLWAQRVNLGARRTLIRKPVCGPVLWSGRSRRALARVPVCQPVILCVSPWARLH